MNLIPVCKTCRKPKANYLCGICQEHVCKSCAQFLTDDSFSFLRKIPADLSHTSYCTNCFDEKVAAPLDAYNTTMAAAKELMVFTKDQIKSTAHLKRREELLTVEDCEDEQETIVRLAFFAAEKHFNCLLDVNITHRKIIVGSHKKTIFSGTAIPITIDPKAVREY